MFTDIVGYTALMGNDEQKAFELLKKNREIQKPIIEEFNGRWIKELGDGVMASFNTVSDAVHAAIKIQEKCTNENLFHLRIGIHLGEVVFENDDVFGDGVNIASRIQAIAKPGAIYMSESVHLNVSNKQEINTRFVRLETLKNVSEPVKIYEVISEKKNSFPEPSQGKSIAVLPFVNMSNDPEQEYFGDGMAEEIINSLIHLKDLKVAGRTSSFQFKGKNLDLRELGQKLGVNTILEGSVRKQDNRLRITVQLINVSDGFHLWSEKYDREMVDVFAIQDEISLAITEKLKITLLEKDRELLTKTFTHNPEAYELYLKGRFQLNRRGSFILSAIEYFKQAIAIDPDYALAHVGYADAYGVAAGYGFYSGKAVMEKIKRGIDAAISLDPTIGEAYCSLASYYNLNRNWEESRKNFIKSIELKPKYSQAYAWYGMIYLGFVRGNFQEALKYGEIAIKLEPLSSICHADLAWTLHTAGRFEEAVTVSQTAIELDPNSFLSHYVAGISYLGLKEYEKAIRVYKSLSETSGNHQQAVNALIWCYCSKGNKIEAELLMNNLKKRSATEYIAGTYFGLSAAYLGDLDTAFASFERAFEEYDIQLFVLKHDPIVPASIRNDERYRILLGKMKFPE